MQLDDDAVKTAVTRLRRAEGQIGGVASVAQDSAASAQQVSASTQQTSASTQEISASAQELAATAEELGISPSARASS